MVLQFMILMMWFGLVNDSSITLDVLNYTSREADVEYPFSNNG